MSLNLMFITVVYLAEVVIQLLGWVTSQMKTSCVGSHLLMPMKDLMVI